MDSPLLTSVVLVLGILFGFFSLLVESQNPLSLPPPHQSPPPPPVSPPPPPPPPVSPPPPPPVSPPPPPPPPSPRVPPPPPSPRTPTPPPKKTSHRPNSTQPSRNKTPDHRLHKHKIPPPSKEKLNLGKKIGLLFMGIVVILQVCVVAFLMIKRRQLFKDQFTY